MFARQGYEQIVKEFAHDPAAASARDRLAALK
jgi:hypothetical protein